MIVIYAPYPSPDLVRDGWMRRIATLERIFADRERAYLFPGDAAWAADPRDYRVHTNEVAPGATFTWLDLRFSNHHRYLTELIERCDFVYAHTSHSAQHLLPYYATGKVVTDLHGIAPEEETLQDKPRRAAFYGAFEETMVRHSALLVSVTEAMVAHLRQKYPGLNTEAVLLPIVEDIGADVSLQRSERARLRVVYVGGLQRWQNVERMLDVVAHCRERCDFRFYTDRPDALAQLARQRGVADAIQIATASPAQLPDIYGDADLGFVVRDDIAVNRVSCPTKLSEYLACGVVPVVALAEIGDFAAMGYRYVTVDDLLAGRLPSAEELAAMRERNREVFGQVQKRFAEGEVRLRQLSPPRTAAHDQAATFLTTLERAMFYPRRGTSLEIERDDGRHALPFDDVVAARQQHELELPGSGALRAVRFCPGDAPFVTTPIELEIVTSAGVATRIDWQQGCVPDRLGNWLFGDRGVKLEVTGLQISDAQRLRLRYEYLLVGPEAYVAGIEPQLPRSAVLRGLSQMPGAKAAFNAWQRLRRRFS